MDILYFKKFLQTISPKKLQEDSFDLNLAKSIISKIKVGKPFSYFSEVDGLKYDCEKVSSVQLDPEDNSIIVHGKTIETDEFDKKRKINSFTVWPDKSLLKTL